MIYINHLTFIAGHEKVVGRNLAQSFLERLTRAPVKTEKKKQFVPSVDRFPFEVPATDTVFTVPTSEREELRAVMHACTPNAAAGLYRPWCVLCGREEDAEMVFTDSHLYDSIEKALRRMDRQHPAWLQPYVDQVRDVFTRWAAQGFTHIGATVKGPVTRADLSMLTPEEHFNL